VKIDGHHQRGVAIGTAYDGHAEKSSILKTTTITTSIVADTCVLMLFSC